MQNIILDTGGISDMIRRLAGSKKASVFIVVVLVSIFAAASVQAVVMNGKEVTPYVGHIVSHNHRTGEIVVKTENSTGHWRLHRHVTVLNEGKASERLNIEEIWRKTKKVRVWVSEDGEVERISVLEWK